VFKADRKARVGNLLKDKRVGNVSKDKRVGSVLQNKKYALQNCKAYSHRFTKLHPGTRVNRCVCVCKCVSVQV
jgi:hypothetical protein